MTLIQKKGGELSVGLGQDAQRTLREALECKFSLIASTIRSLDARKANVTVESDRTNIFGAIRQLPDGFDGLNRDLRRALARWLADTSESLLDRMDPCRCARPLPPTRLAASDRDSSWRGEALAVDISACICAYVSMHLPIVAALWRAPSLV